jgi:hypothetical protein
MLAAPAPGAPTRLERAKVLAGSVRAGLRDVRTGVASLTDRLLLHLPPQADTESFHAVVTHALAVGRPPGSSNAALGGTSFDALGPIANGNFFSFSARKRLAVVLSDGESLPLVPGVLDRQLRTGHVALLLVRVGNGGERIYRARGAVDPGYRAERRPAALQDLAPVAVGRRSFTEAQLPAAIEAARAYLGQGPTVRAGTEPRTHALAPYLLVGAALPLGLLLRWRNRG